MTALAWHMYIQAFFWGTTLCYGGQSDEYPIITIKSCANWSLEAGASDGGCRVKPESWQSRNLLIISLSLSSYIG